MQAGAQTEMNAGLGAKKPGLWRHLVPRSPSHRPACPQWVGFPTYEVNSVQPLSLPFMGLFTRHALPSEVCPFNQPAYEAQLDYHHPQEAFPDCTVCVMAQ